MISDKELVQRYKDYASGNKDLTQVTPTTVAVNDTEIQGARSTVISKRVVYTKSKPTRIKQEVKQASVKFLIRRGVKLFVSNNLESEVEVPLPTGVEPERFFYTGLANNGSDDKDWVVSSITLIKRGSFENGTGRYNRYLISSTTSGFIDYEQDLGTAYRAGYRLESGVIRQEAPSGFAFSNGFFTSIEPNIGIGDGLFLSNPDLVIPQNNLNFPIQDPDPTVFTTFSASGLIDPEFAFLYYKLRSSLTYYTQIIYINYLNPISDGNGGNIYEEIFGGFNAVTVVAEQLVRRDQLISSYWDLEDFNFIVGSVGVVPAVQEYPALQQFYSEDDSVEVTLYTRILLIGADKLSAVRYKRANTIELLVIDSPPQEINTLETTVDSIDQPTSTVITKENLLNRSDFTNLNGSKLTKCGIYFVKKPDGSVDTEAEIEVGVTIWDLDSNSISFIILNHPPFGDDLILATEAFIP